MPQDNSLFPANNYDVFLKDLITRIRRSQVKAALAVNQELIILYWQIGQERGMAPIHVKMGHIS